jgi:hypothetical protein
MTEADDHLWDLWADALIDCEVDGQVRCVRGPNAHVLPAAAPIFTVTAYNPGGDERDAALNAEGERALEQELVASGMVFWPATGHSADGTWSEPGVAVAGIDRSEACAIGRRYGQLGVFELTDTEVHVVRCNDEAIVRTRARES